jgi:signal transduction histidine kinase
MAGASIAIGSGDAHPRMDTSVNPNTPESAPMAGLAALGELATVIAPELSQPLAAILAQADACLRWLDREAPRCDEARAAATAIIAEARRAGHVIQALHGLSNERQLRIEMRVHDAIEDAVATIEPELAQSSVSLQLELAPGLPVIIGDRRQLTQVVAHLLNNAVQAMAPVHDRPRKLVVGSRQARADQVVVTVQDSGTGIEACHMNRIFDAFFTTRPGRAGIGLSHSRAVIAAHGGAIWACPGRQHGAAFHFTLPACA